MSRRVVARGGKVKEGFFPGEGPRIYWRAHLPEAAVASLAIIHGYGEHSGRYAELADTFASRDIATWLIDLRGHGRSEGKRGYIRDFNGYLEDVDLLVSMASEAGHETFLLGHSHGGLLTLRYLLERRRELAGAILSAPYLALAFEPPAWKLALAQILRGVLPWLPIPSGVDVEMLTSDEVKVREAKNDPLRFETATPGWFFEMRRVQEEVRRRGREIDLPILGLLPLDDPVVRAEDGRAFLESLVSEDKRIVTFEGAKHEIFNEVPPVRERAVEEVANWILEHARDER